MRHDQNTARNRIFMIHAITIWYDLILQDYSEGKITANAIATADLIKAQFAFLKPRPLETFGLHQNELALPMLERWKRHLIHYDYSLLEPGLIELEQRSFIRRCEIRTNEDTLVDNEIWIEWERMSSRGPAKNTAHFRDRLLTIPNREND